MWRPLKKSISPATIRSTPKRDVRAADLTPSENASRQISRREAGVRIRPRTFSAVSWTSVTSPRGPRQATNAACARSSASGPHCDSAATPADARSGRTRKRRARRRHSTACARSRRRRQGRLNTRPARSRLKGATPTRAGCPQIVSSPARSSVASAAGRFGCRAAARARKSTIRRDDRDVDVGTRAVSIDLEERKAHRIGRDLPPLVRDLRPASSTSLRAAG